VSKRRIANGWAIKAFAVAVPRYLGSLLRLDLGSSITDQGSRRLVSDQQYFPATGTGSLQHGDGADYWNWRWCFRMLTEHDFRYRRKAVWNYYYLCASDLLGEDAHAVNFAVQLRWVPLRVAFPRLAATALWSRRDFGDSLLGGNRSVFGHLLSRAS